MMVAQLTVADEPNWIALPQQIGGLMDSRWNGRRRASCCHPAADLCYVRRASRLTDTQFINCIVRLKPELLAVVGDAAR